MAEWIGSIVRDPSRPARHFDACIAFDLRIAIRNHPCPPRMPISLSRRSRKC